MQMIRLYGQAKYRNLKFLCFLLEKSFQSKSYRTNKKFSSVFWNPDEMEPQKSD